MDFEQLQIDTSAKQYWEGHENRLIRLWVYTQRGLQMINEFKYLVAGILAIYALLKFHTPIWMLIVVVVSIPPLIILGRWQLRKIQRVSEWVGNMYGSVVGFRQYNCEIEMLKNLREINEKLEKLTKDNSLKTEPEKDSLANPEKSGSK